MFINILKFFWSLRGQFVKYFIVGISGLAIGMGLLIFFKEVFGLWPVTAAAISGLLGIAYNFLLNKYWSFKDKSMPHRQFARYLILVGFNYGFSIAAMYVFNHLAGWDYRLVNLATVAVMVSWNFFLYKYWVYKQPKSDLSAGARPHT